MRAAMQGEAIQPSRKGAATGKAAGCNTNNARVSTHANNGAAIIACHADLKCSLLPKSWTVWAALIHCSILLCVTNRRTRVVEIASKIMKDSCGRKMISNSERSVARRIGRVTMVECSLEKL